MIVVEGVSQYLELTSTCTRLTKMTEMEKKRVIELMKKISTELNVHPASSESLCGPIQDPAVRKARKDISVVRVTIPQGLRQMFDPPLPAQVALTYTCRELDDAVSLGLVFESYWGLTLNGHKMTSDGVYLFKQMVALTRDRMQEEMDKQMLALTGERMQEEMDDKKIDDVWDDVPWKMSVSGDLHDCDIIMTGETSRKPTRALADDWIDDSHVGFIESSGFYTVGLNVLADSVEIRVQCT